MQPAKIGRPKKEQTKPLIFERVRSRTVRQVSMSAKTAEDLTRYVTWAASEVGADEDEALTLTLDQALGQFFQRDRLFQESLDDKTEGGGPSTTKPAAGNPPSTATRPSPAAAPALPAPRAGGATQ